MYFARKTVMTVFIIGMIIPSTSKSQSLISVLKDTEEISIFVKTLKKSGLEERMVNSGPFTIFAPENSVFEKEIESKSDEKIKELLLNHIITGWATKKNIKEMSRVTSLGGLTLIIENEKEKEKDTIRINGATIVRTCYKNKNGVVHVVDKVLK